LAIWWRRIAADQAMLSGNDDEVVIFWTANGSKSTAVIVRAARWPCAVTYRATIDIATPIAPVEIHPRCAFAQAKMTPVLCGNAQFIVVARSFVIDLGMVVLAD
jgi:hypothetical protein